VARIPFFAAGLGLAVALASGCDREAEPLVCTELPAGDLVISEVRGGPSVVDVTDGEWIELYNASAGPVELEGIAITIKALDGNPTFRLLLRHPHTVAAGDYAVVGKFEDAQRPSHVDIGWGNEPSILRAGVINLACAEDVIDQFAYGRPDLDPLLPDPAEHRDSNPPSQPPEAGRGTYALGVMPPDATANDDTANWCVDGTETLGPCSNNECLEFYKGSPGEPNPACPP
jgi:hypothetical protein